MRTLFGAKDFFDSMIEEMRLQEIDEIFPKWEEATRLYHQQGYDNGESTELCKKLLNLGVGIDVLVDEESRIRDEVAKEIKS